MFCEVQFSQHPANIYLFKVNNKKIREMCEICSKLTIETPERYQWQWSGVFIVYFEHISHLFCASIVDFEQINVTWAELFEISVKFECVSLGIKFCSIIYYHTREKKQQLSFRCSDISNTTKSLEELKEVVLFAKVDNRWKFGIYSFPRITILQSCQPRHFRKLH